MGSFMISCFNLLSAAIIVSSLNVTLEPAFQHLVKGFKMSMKFGMNFLK